MLSSGLPQFGYQAIVTPPPMLTSGLQQTYNLGGGIVDADPFTPGIQAQPGTIIQTGPSTILSSGIKPFGGMFQTGPIDMDPITPGIQTQAGTVTITGPSTVVSTGFNGIGGQPIGGIIDADPLTPGIQAQPGTIIPTGQSYVVGNLNQGGFGGCPWWLWLLVALLLVGGLIGAFSWFRSRG